MARSGWAIGVQLQELLDLQDCLAALGWMQRVRHIGLDVVSGHPSADRPLVSENLGVTEGSEPFGNRPSANEGSLKELVAPELSPTFKESQFAADGKDSSGSGAEPMDVGEGSVPGSREAAPGGIGKSWLQASRSQISDLSDATIRDPGTSS